MESQVEKLRNSAELSESFLNIGRSIEPIRPIETYDELKRTGKLTIIEDAALTNALDAFYFAYDVQLSDLEEQGDQDKIAFQNLWSRNIRLNEYQFAKSVDYKQAHKDMMDRMLHLEDFYKVLMEMLHSADIDENEFKNLNIEIQKIISYIETNHSGALGLQ
jgi:hypothetical protein